MSFSDSEMKLARFFVEREGEGVLEVIRDIDFFDAGIIDSLDMVSLGVYVEKTFGKKLDLTDAATLTAARRFDALMALVDKPADTQPAS
jgi:acyl carrier protein